MNKNIDLGLTKRECEIIELIYRFRFLNRIQIQEMMDHKSHGQINFWLRDLTAKKYIGRIWNSRWRENTKPGVYFLGPKGVDYILKFIDFDNKYLKKYYKEDKRSFITVDHSLWCANFYLMVKRQINYKEKSLVYLSENDLLNKEFQKDVRADGYIKFKSNDELVEFFIEIDLETESRATFKKKVAKYLDYYQLKNWRRYFNRFPTILVVCFEEERFRKLKTDSEEMLLEKNFPEVIFQFTVFKKIENEGINGDIWFSAYDEDRLGKLIY